MQWLQFSSPKFMEKSLTQCLGVTMLLFLCGATSRTDTGSGLAEGKLATIDMKRIFDGYWKKQAAEARLKDQQAEMQKEEKKLSDEFNQEKDDYEKLNSSTGDSNISPEERDKRKNAADQKMRKMNDIRDALKQFDANTKTRIMETGDRLKKQIIEEIKNVVAGRAKAHGFALVIDTAAVSGEGTPVVLYSNNENDLTDAVASELKRGAPADTKIQEEPAAGKADGKGSGKK